MWGIYAATSSISVTLALALMTFVFTHYEGIRADGPVRYFKELDSRGPEGDAADARAASNPRSIPLSFRSQSSLRPTCSRELHADPDLHRTDLRSRIGRSRRGRRACRNRLLPLRGRDRRLDPGVHLRRPVSHLHRLGDRAGQKERECPISFLPPPRGTSSTSARRSPRARIGLGSLGANIGIGNIFGSMIQSVARQPELRGELTGIMWRGLR